MVGWNDGTNSLSIRRLIYKAGLGSLIGCPPTQPPNQLFRFLDKL